MKESKMLSLSVVSHELRNPLTLIHSTLQIIGNHHPEVRIDPMWSQVISEIQYMSQLLTELSSLNQSQKLRYVKVDIRQVLNALMERFSVEAEKEGKHLMLRFETESTIFEADEIKIKEMLLNLIQNAMEATKKGDRIEVVVQSKWDQLIVNVCDSGSGMDMERQKNVFEPFVTYRAGGTGLGLAVVKNIVDAHRGIIQVYSKPSEGTKFVIILPRSCPETKE